MEEKANYKDPISVQAEPPRWQLLSFAHHFHRHVATQQSGKLIVETFANPTRVSNIYADSMTFCLRVTEDMLQGHKFLTNALSPSGAWDKGSTLNHD